MGVKDLWAILDPIAEDISLGYLYGKTVAIDLSAWICDSQAVGQIHRNIQRPDLRNTFFRASRLVLSNITPVFILEGEAPELKHATIRQRNATQWSQSQQSQTSQGSCKLKKPRSQYQSRLKPMLRLLDAMGLPYIQSDGEAEKLCAFLNKEGVVDAVISQDSDCLLYGAQDVLRHFSVSKGTANARKYSARKARDSMGLDREQLVVLSLLLGCDYCPGGVPGVGREQALHYLKGLKGSPLNRIRSWQSDAKLCQLESERVQMSQPRTCANCWHAGTAHKHATKGCDICFTSKGCTVQKSVLKNEDENSKWQLLELQIRNRALQDPGFPSEEIIQEFLDDDVIWEQVQIRWKQPDAKQLLDICSKLLGWERSDSIEKVLQLVSRWQCHQIISKPSTSFSLHPISLLKLKVQQSIKCIEVQWATINAFPINAEEISAFTTLEPIALFTQAYPVLYQHFEDAKIAAKKKSKKTTATKPRKKLQKTCTACGCEENKTSSRNGHICQFVKKNHGVDKLKLDILEEMMTDLDLDESIPEHELSGIVSSIVSRGSQVSTVCQHQKIQVMEDTLHDMSVQESETCETLKSHTSSKISIKYENSHVETGHYFQNPFQINNVSSKTESINDKLGEGGVASNLSVQLLDTSIDDKENHCFGMQELNLDQTSKSYSKFNLKSEHTASSSMQDSEFNVTYENFYDFGNISYREDYNMPSESTPVSAKSKRTHKSNSHTNNFSLGIDSLLEFDMSLTE